MKKKYYGIFIIIFLLGIMALSSGLFQHLSLESLQQHARMLTQYAHNHPVLSLCIYMVSYTVAAFLPTPGEALLSIAGGYLYGPVAGIPLATLGTTLGAVLAFFVTRFFIGNFIKKKFWREYTTMKSALAQHGTYILLSLRIIPTIPSSVVNYISGILPVSFPVFLITTTLGVLPLTSLYVVAGQKLTELKSINEVMTPTWLLIFFCLALLTSLPVIIKMVKKNRASS